MGNEQDNVITNQPISEAKRADIFSVYMSADK